MSRKTSRQQVGVALFPFLAVLICTMGALIVLLVLLVQQARVDAKTIVAAQIGGMSEEDQKQLRERLEDARWQRELLEKSRAEKTEELAQARARLGHLEEHKQRLEAQARELLERARSIDEGKKLRNEDLAAARAEAARLKAEIERKQRELDEAKKKAGEGQEWYALIPYDGRSGTRRRPIYVECTEFGVVVQPEGLLLKAEDFNGPLGPGNPLDMALRTIREHLERTAGAKAGQPYPLLVVRPSGVLAFGAARAAIKAWDDEWGYELISDEKQLDFGPPDTALSATLSKTVAVARQRQAAMIAMIPRHFQDEEPLKSFAHEPTIHNTGNRYVGPGSGGIGSGPGTGRSGVAGTGYGPGGVSGMGGGSAGAAGAGMGGTSGTGGNGTGGGNGVAGSGSGLPSVTGSLTGAPGSGATAGTGSASNMSASGRAGAGSGAAGGSFPGSPLSGGGNTGGSSGTGAGGGGQQGMGSSPGAAGTQSFGNSGQTGGSGGTGGNQFGGQSGASGGSGSSDSPSGSAGSSSMSSGSQAGSSSFGGDSSMSASSPGSVGIPTLTFGSPKTSPSAAASSQTSSNSGSPRSTTKRGNNWALPQAKPNQIGVTRPIRISVQPDRVVMVPERGDNRQAKTVPVAPELTQDDVNNFVSAVQSEVKGWGLAVSDGYWKPVLQAEVAPGAERHFMNLETALKGSGIEIIRR